MLPGLRFWADMQCWSCYRFVWGIGLAAVFAGVSIFAVLRGLLRYGEQSCNHYIAFKLLALLRDRVFSALRRLCPAKLEEEIEEI